MLYWSGDHVCKDRGQFRCGDGSCISILLRCDGFKDCPHDGSDEFACRKYSSTRTKKCLMLFKQFRNTRYDNFKHASQINGNVIMVIV